MPHLILLLELVKFVNDELLIIRELGEVLHTHDMKYVYNNIKEPPMISSLASETKKYVAEM